MLMSFWLLVFSLLCFFPINGGRRGKKEGGEIITEIKMREGRK